LSDEPSLNKESRGIIEEQNVDSSQDGSSHDEEMNGDGLVLSETDCSKDMTGNQNLNNLSNGLLKQHVVSARGSFAMLHDHTGPK